MSVPIRELPEDMLEPASWEDTATKMADEIVSRIMGTGLKPAQIALVVLFIVANISKKLKLKDEPQQFQKLERAVEEDVRLSSTALRLLRIGEKLLKKKLTHNHVMGDF